MRYYAPKKKKREREKLPRSCNRHRRRERVATGQEPVIQPQGIRRAILEEGLENEKRKRSELMYRGRGKVKWSIFII